MGFEVRHTDELLILSGHGDEIYEFPIVWLRDNCLCAECFHFQTAVRIIDLDSFDFNVKIESFKVS